MINFDQHIARVSGRHVAGAVFVLMFITYLWIGIIPIDGGAGWDGNVYLNYINSIAAGHPVVGDPYRSIRLSGFLQLVPFAWRGEGKETLVFIQLAFNIALMSAGAGCLYSALKTLGVDSKKAVLSVALLVLSWACLVMPVFYPMLSDNLAIPLCCIAVWCWANEKHLILYALCAWFTWLFPGLFLIPLGLVSFPLKKHQAPQPFQNRPLLKLSVFALFLAIGLAAYYFIMSKITVEAIAAHSVSGDGQTAIIALLPVSYIAQSLMIAALAWIGSSVLCSAQFYRSIKVSNFIVGVGAIGLSFLIMKLLIDFSSGFQGPPLLDFLMMQSAAAPLKPWVAHFLYFGFVVLLVFAHCIRGSFRSGHAVPMGLMLTFIALLPFLSFGSESRQWVGVFPVVISIYALMDINRRQQVFLVIASAISLMTMHGIQAGAAKASGFGLSMQSPEWQYYFGRLGPWMSADVYKLGLMALMLVCVIYSVLGVKPTGIKKLIASAR